MILKVRNKEGEERAVPEDYIDLAESDGFYPVISNGKKEKVVNYKNIKGYMRDGYDVVSGEKKSIGDKALEVGQSTISGIADAVTFGYGPELYESMTGQPAAAYEQYADKMRKQQPHAEMAGQLIGNLVPATGLAKGVGVLTKGRGMLAKGAGILAEGAITAGAQKANSLEQKAENALAGALFSGVGGLAGKSLQKGSELAKDAAKTLRISGIGTYLRDMKSIAGQNRTDEVIQFIKDNKLLVIGDTVEDVLAKSKPLVNDYGKKLGQLYKRAVSNFDEDDFLDKLTPKQEDKWLESGFFPGSQAKEILVKVQEELGDAVGGEGGLRTAAKYLQQIITKYGDDIDLKQAHKIRGEVDDFISYTRDPQAKQPVAERAFKVIRKHISDKIEAQLELIDDVIGGESAKELRKYNNLYSNAITVKNIAERKVQRDTARNFLGLSEVLGGIGLGANEFRMDRDPVAVLLAGLGGASVVKGIRKAGPGAGATAGDILDPVLQKAAKASDVARMAINAEAAEDSTIDVFKNPKGPYKWRRDGINSIINYTGDESWNSLTNNEDPKVERYIREISALKAGSKPFKNLLEKIKTRKGEGF